MKTATIYSVCECQAKLGAVLDEQKYVVRGWARDRRTGRELVAPAHSIGAASSKFQVGWACPFCTRNLLRSFDESALAFVAPPPERTSSPPARSSAPPARPSVRPAGT
ncbi:MAG TPA: hypothetical protein VHE30_26040 [Polyangiaceae bacterium]|nr:hypothetical protein [Polyangiaceae bacterium]